MNLAERIARRAEYLYARESRSGTARIRWPRLEAVDPVRALKLLRASPLADFVPPVGENLGFPPSDYYGSEEYLMPEELASASVVAEVLGPFVDQSQLWNLALVLRTGWGNVKIGIECSRGSNGAMNDQPYVYDRVWIMAYAETGYEDGTPRREGVYDAKLAGALFAIIQELLREREGSGCERS